MQIHLLYMYYDTEFLCAVAGKPRNLEELVALLQRPRALLARRNACGLMYLVRLQQPVVLVV